MKCSYFSVSPITSFSPPPPNKSILQIFWTFRVKKQGRRRKAMRTNFAWRCRERYTKWRQETKIRRKKKRRGRRRRQLLRWVICFFRASYLPLSLPVWLYLSSVRHLVEEECKEQSQFFLVWSGKGRLHTPGGTKNNFHRSDLLLSVLRVSSCVISCKFAQTKLFSWLSSGMRCYQSELSLSALPQLKQFIHKHQAFYPVFSLVLSFILALKFMSFNALLMWMCISPQVITVW